MAQLVLGLPSVLGIRVVRENVTGYMIESAFVAVAVIGLLHGLEPGHGWPVAMLYAARSSRPLLRRFVSSWIIASAHLVSSLAIVGPFALLRAYGGFALPYVNYIAGGALVAMAAKLFLEKPKDGLEDQHGHIHDSFTGDHEHEHKHPDGEKHMHRHRHAKKLYLTLSRIAVFALILGFAHEEEFVLLALAVGGIDPFLLMLTYALAVMAGLVGVTLMAVRIYGFLELRLKKYEPYLPTSSQG